MSNRTAPAPFTISDAIDRAVCTFASIMLTLAMLALAYRFQTEGTAGWAVLVESVRTVWDVVVSAAGYLIR